MEIDENRHILTVKLPKGMKNELMNRLIMNPPKFKFKVQIDNFIYILSKIFKLATSTPKFKNMDKVPISSTILMHEIGRNYRLYLDYLIDNKLIETDNHYKVGIIGGDPGKCKCYSLTKKYKNDVVEYHSLSRKSLIAHYIKWKTSLFSSIADDTMLDKLHTMLDKFNIDIDGADKYLHDLQLSDPSITDEMIALELKKCKKINNKTLNNSSMYLVRDDYNRIHTNLTNLSRHVRENFLFLEGKQVKSLDIVSSQASLLYTMVKDHIDNTEKKVMDTPCKLPGLQQYAFSGEAMNHFRTDIRKKYVNSKNKYYGEPLFDANDGILLDYMKESTIPLLNYPSYDEQITAGRIDLIKMEHVLKNGIYEFFQDKWKEYYGEIKTRTEMKKLWIKYIFGVPKYSNKKMRNIWNKEFPAIERIVDHFKVIDYRHLAHNLQRTEANIMYNKVCTSIDDTLNIPYGTVHDSIIIAAEHYDSVKAIFSTVLIENNIITGIK